MTVNLFNFSVGISVPMSVSVVVKDASTGLPVKDFDGNDVMLFLDSEQRWIDVKKEIAALTFFCTCTVSLIVGKEFLMDGGKVSRQLDLCKSDNVLQVVRRGIPPGNAKDFHENGFCVTCMRKAGIGAKEIIECWSIQATAVLLRDAGFSLADIVNCFPEHRHPRRTHPPLTALTLFDSQLKGAGYTARDFRSAGFDAQRLSEPWFWKDEGDITACELEWFACYAFFNVCELKEAGYSARELRDASFCVSDLEKAGFSAVELESLGASPCTRCFDDDVFSEGA